MGLLKNPINYPAAPFVCWFPAPNDASLLFRAGQV